MAQPTYRAYNTHSEVYAKQQKLLEPFHRRDYVIQQIGLDNLDAFELWAFPKNPHIMIYNDEIQFHWANGHSTKGIPQDPDEAIKAIIEIWNTRFKTEA